MHAHDIAVTDAPDAKQMEKDNGKCWSSYNQWRNLLLLTP